MLGISEYLVRRFAQSPATLEHDAGIALVVQGGVTLLGAAALAAIGQVLPFGQMNYPLLLACLLPMLIAPAETTLLSAFRGREQHRSYAWFSASRVVLYGVGGIAVQAVTGDVVMSNLVGGLLVIANTLCGWWLSRIRPIWPRVDRRLWDEFGAIVRVSFPFLSWQVIQLAYSQIDRLLLGALVSAVEVGWYAAANRIVGIPIFIPTLIITPLLPALSRSAHDPHVLRRTISQTIRVVLLLTVPLRRHHRRRASHSTAVGLARGLLERGAANVDSGPAAAASRHRDGTGRGLHGDRTRAPHRHDRPDRHRGQRRPELDRDSHYRTAVPQRWYRSRPRTDTSCEVLMLVGSLLFLGGRLLDPGIAWAATRIMVAGIATTLVGLTLLPIALALAIIGGAAAYFATAIALRVLTRDDVEFVQETVLSGRRLPFSRR